MRRKEAKKRRALGLAAFAFGARASLARSQISRLSLLAAAAAAVLKAKACCGLLLVRFGLGASYLVSRASVGLGPAGFGVCELETHFWQSPCHSSRPPAESLAIQGSVCKLHEATRGQRGG